MATRLFKILIWVHLSLGVLIILAILFAIFVLPALSADGGVSVGLLNLMEKILLLWGIIFVFLGKIMLPAATKKKVNKTDGM